MAGPQDPQGGLEYCKSTSGPSNVRGDPSDHSAQVIIRILAPYVENFNIENAQNGVEKGASADDRHI